MVIGVPDYSAIHRRKLPSVIHAQHHLRRLLRQITQMNALEYIKNGESFRQLSGSLLGLFGHREVFGCRIDPRDAGRVVAMVSRTMRRL